MSPESCREGPHLIIEHQVSEVARGALIPHQRAGQYSRRRKTLCNGNGRQLAGIVQIQAPLPIAAVDIYAWKRP
jgi:hypothetical protein